LAGQFLRTIAMKTSPKLIFLACVALLTGCSTDPNRQKLKYLNDGEKYFTAGRYQEAVIQFRNAVQIDPKFAGAHYQLSLAYQALHDPEAAYREITASVTLDPKNADAQLQLAALLISRRQYDKAEAAALAVLQVDPKNTRAH